MGPIVGGNNKLSQVGDTGLAKRSDFRGNGRAADGNSVRLVSESGRAY